MAKPPPIVGRSAIGVGFSEAARNWPFVFGFAVTLGIVTWMSKNLDPKDAQKSPFINPDAHRYGVCLVLLMGGVIHATCLVLLMLAKFHTWLLITQPGDQKHTELCELPARWGKSYEAQHLSLVTN